MRYALALFGLAVTTATQLAGDMLDDSGMYRLVNAAEALAMFALKLVVAESARAHSYYSVRMDSSFNILAVQVWLSQRI